MEEAARDAEVAAKWLESDPTEVPLLPLAGEVAKRGRGRGARSVAGDAKVTASRAVLKEMASGSRGSVVREMLEPPEVVWHTFGTSLDATTIRRAWQQTGRVVADTFEVLLEESRSNSLKARGDILKRLMVETKVNTSRGFTGPMDETELARALEEVELEELDRERKSVGVAGKSAIQRTKSMSGRLNARHGGAAMRVKGAGDSLSGWSELSPDLKQQVLSRLQPADVASAARVCWSFARAAQQYLGKAKHVNVTQLVRGRSSAVGKDGAGTSGGGWSHLSGERAIHALRAFPAATSLGLRGLDMTVFDAAGPRAWERLWESIVAPAKVRHVDCHGMRGFNSTCLVVMLDALPRLGSLDLGGLMAHPRAPNNPGLDEDGVAWILGDARRVPALEKLVLPGSASCTGKLNSGGGRTVADVAPSGGGGRRGTLGSTLNSTRGGESARGSTMSSVGARTGSAGVQGRRGRGPSDVNVDCVTQNSLQALLAMPNSPPLLGQLDISGCHAVTAEALKLCVQRQFELRERLPPRITGNIGAGHKVDDGLRVLRANNLGKLRILALDMADPAAAPLKHLHLAACPRLESLDISSPQLEILSLSHCKNLRSVALRAPELGQLDASGCAKLESVGSSRFPRWELYTKRGLPADGLLDLETINMFGCRLLPDEALHHVLLRCSAEGKLKRLTADGCISLRSVDLGGHGDGPVLPMLENLSLSGCPSLLSLVTAPGCANLSSVDVHACRNLRRLDVVREKGFSVQTSGCTSLR